MNFKDFLEKHYKKMLMIAILVVVVWGIYVAVNKENFEKVTAEVIKTVKEEITGQKTGCDYEKYGYPEVFQTNKIMQNFNYKSNNDCYEPAEFNPEGVEDHAWI